MEQEGAHCIKYRLNHQKRPAVCGVNFSRQSPPRFSAMHRFGIASAIDDKTVPDGTAVEEVRDFHRETLRLCVDEANKKEADYRREEQRKKEAEERITVEYAEYRTTDYTISEVKYAERNSNETGGCHKYVLEKGCDAKN